MKRPFRDSAQKLGFSPLGGKNTSLDVQKSAGQFGGFVDPSQVPPLTFPPMAAFLGVLPAPALGFGFLGYVSGPSKGLETQGKPPP